MVQRCISSSKPILGSVAKCPKTIPRPYSFVDVLCMPILTIWIKQSPVGTIMNRIVQWRYEYESHLKIL